MPLIPVLLIVMLGLAALVLGIGTLEVNRSQLQTQADAQALRQAITCSCAQTVTLDRAVTLPLMGDFTIHATASATRGSTTTPGSPLPMLPWIVRPPGSSITFDKSTMLLLDGIIPRMAPSGANLNIGSAAAIDSLLSGSTLVWQTWDCSTPCVVTSSATTRRLTNSGGTVLITTGKQYLVAVAAVADPFRGSTYHVTGFAVMTLTKISNSTYRMDFTGQTYTSIAASGPPTITPGKVRLTS